MESQLQIGAAALSRANDGRAESALSELAIEHAMRFTTCGEP